MVIQTLVPFLKTRHQLFFFSPFSLHFYRKQECTRCNRWFSSNYFYQHFRQCCNERSINDETLNNLPVTNDLPYSREEQETQQNSNTIDSNSDSSDASYDEEIMEMSNTLNNENVDMTTDVFEESILNTTSTTLSIISWICLFLSLWQYYFNITDGAMEILVKFLAQLWNVLVDSFQLEAGVAAGFPASLYLFQKIFFKKKDKFVKYVACIKCHFPL